MRRVSLYVTLFMLAVMLFTFGALPARAEVLPKIIPLPDGFRPEGIARGYHADLYIGSLVNGAIYQANLYTGEGEILIPGQEGRVAVGLDFDPRTGYLFVAGGATGFAYVYDTKTGEEVASIQLTTAPTFINAVVVTPKAAYFTDSQQPQLYRVPLSLRGRLSDPPEAEVLPLTGDWEQVPGFNANGIDATLDGRALIVVNSTTGLLYRVNPRTGVATEIDLGGDTLTMGDGILLEGRTLYVVRNRLNLIAVVQLSLDLSSGEVVREITDPDFRVPTSIASFGPWLYAVNARFDVPNPGPETEYEVVRVGKYAQP